MIAPRPWLCAGGSSSGNDTGTTGALGSVGPTFPGSAVLTGGATGSLGSNAGLAECEGCSATVVGSASVGRAVGVGSSNAAGVNIIGGSKSARVVSPAGSVYIPVHADAHIGSRENTSIGGIITGRYGGPIVVITVPSSDVLNPKPQVGQARSLISIGAIPSVKSISPSILPPFGSFQIWPTVKMFIADSSY